MRAALITGPNRILIDDVQRPQPKAGEAVVKVLACGVCGTDVHILAGEFPVRYPCIAGHEAVGVVEDIGDDASGIKAGDMVAIDPAVVCNSCRLLPPEQAESLRELRGDRRRTTGRLRRVRRGPSGQPLPRLLQRPRVGDLIEPLACVIWGHERARLHLGDAVLIFGAGPWPAAPPDRAARRRLLGRCRRPQPRPPRARPISRRAPLRAGRRRKLLETVRGHEPRGYEPVIDATGSVRALTSAVQPAKNGGALLIFGVCPKGEKMEISPFDVYSRDLTILGIFLDPAHVPCGPEDDRRRATRARAALGGTLQPGGSPARPGGDGHG